MITIQLKFFASLREALGEGLSLSLPEGATIGQARAQLRERGEAFANALAPGRAVRAALNQQLADEGAKLSAGDELAFFPPVTGG